MLNCRPFEYSLFIGVCLFLDPTDEIYIDGSKKKRYKDDEKLPLGEHDELAMI